MPPPVWQVENLGGGGGEEEGGGREEEGGGGREEEEGGGRRGGRRKEGEGGREEGGGGGSVKNQAIPRTIYKVQRNLSRQLHWKRMYSETCIKRPR